MPKSKFSASNKSSRSVLAILLNSRKSTARLCWRSRRVRVRVGLWDFIGIWSLGSEASLDLDVWGWELSSALFPLAVRSRPATLLLVGGDDPLHQRMPHHVALREFHDRDAFGVPGRPMGLQHAGLLRPRQGTSRSTPVP